MKLDFSPTDPATIGVEWELALVDASTGERRLRAACDASEPHACLGLGQLEWKRAREGEDHLKRACDAGYRRGCAWYEFTELLIANDYFVAGVHIDFEIPLGRIRALADSGLAVVLWAVEHFVRQLVGPAGGSPSG